MSALALMLHQMGHRFKGQMLKSIALQRGLEQQEFKFIHLMWKIWKAQDPHCQGAFRPDNNVEIAYADEHENL